MPTPVPVYSLRISPQMATRLLAAAATLAALAYAGLNPLAAQSAGRGFLFDAPKGSITFSGGIDRAGEQSEVFDFSRELLTLSEGDFKSFTLNVEYAHRLSMQVDLLAGLGYSGASERSEFRDWVDENELPIEQTTKFVRLPLTAGARVYLLPRGRSVGRFAWIPSSYAPYLSAGAGVMWYSFSQSGDFVDFQDNEIFADRLESSGWAPTVHGAAGMEVSVSPKLAIMGEARYTWAKASMGDDFSGFDDIDLSGLAATVGLRIRF